MKKETDEERGEENENIGKSDDKDENKEEQIIEKD